MTFSISARCPRTGALGIAIASSSPAVAARCAHVRAGVGVVATQNVTDPRLGPRGLALLAEFPAVAALAQLTEQAPHAAYRQLALVDAQGGSAVFSGAHALGRHGAIAAPGMAVAGNLLANDAVLPAMLAGFAAAPDDVVAAGGVAAGGVAALAERLLAALQAGLAAGGEAGPIRSAGLLLAHEVAWPVADLRVDWDGTSPLAALARLWALWRPQMQVYVTRALDPAAAPAFEVPGPPG